MQQAYDTHQREYTILGITSVIHAMIDETTQNVYGGTFSELFSIVQNGIYYHSLPHNGREIMSGYVVQSFQQRKIDLKHMYDVFGRQVHEYEKLIDQDEKDFSLQTILDFFSFYQNLFPTAYVGMDPIDFTQELSAEEKKEFSDGAEKIRHRAEVIYKRGEMEFIPRYLNWFSSTYALDCSAELLQYIVFTEMKDFIEKGTALPLLQELEERKRSFYVHQYPMGKIEFCSGVLADKKIQEKGFFEKNIDQTQDFVKGQVGYAGMVRGRVCIVKSRAHMSKFQENDIIVSEMTDPSYLPIMKRAMAFVTDEGGMLCHAAIVARELKKPCVIGTKIATHVFKDGDMIEVDANQGIVRKII